MEGRCCERGEGEAVNISRRPSIGVCWKSSKCPSFKISNRHTCAVIQSEVDNLVYRNADHTVITFLSSRDPDKTLEKIENNACPTSCPA